jgi:hypothetical protein
MLRIGRRYATYKLQRNDRRVANGFNHWNS